jgi:hypothetical protein
LRLGRRVWCLRGKEQEENGIGWEDLVEVVNGKE